MARYLEELAFHEFNKLYKEKLLCDIALSLGGLGDLIYVHKLILVGTCDYFRAELLGVNDNNNQQNDPTALPVFVISGLTTADRLVFPLFIDALYGNNIYQGSNLGGMSTLAHLAQRFGAIGVIDQLKKWMRESPGLITGSNVLKYATEYVNICPAIADMLASIVADYLVSAARNDGFDAKLMLAHAADLSSNAARYIFADSIRSPFRAGGLSEDNQGRSPLVAKFLIHWCESSGPQRDRKNAKRVKVDTLPQDVIEAMNHILSKCPIPPQSLFSEEQLNLLKNWEISAVQSWKHSDQKCILLLVGCAWAGSDRAKKDVLPEKYFSEESAEVLVITKHVHTEDDWAEALRLFPTVDMIAFFQVDTPNDKKAVSSALREAVLERHTKVLLGDEFLDPENGFLSPEWYRDCDPFRPRADTPMEAEYDLPSVPIPYEIAPDLPEDSPIRTFFDNESWRALHASPRRFCLLMGPWYHSDREGSLVDHKAKSLVGFSNGRSAFAVRGPVARLGVNISNHTVHNRWFWDLVLYWLQHGDLSTL